MSSFIDFLLGYGGAHGNITGKASLSDVMQGAGAGVLAMGAYQSADAQKQMYDFQAQLARNNSVINDNMAKDALARGATNVQNVQLRTANLKSDQRVAMAANGIDMGGSGTSADILGTTDFMGARDAITAQHNADMESWAYQNKSLQDTSNANMYQSTSDSINPFMSMGTSLLTSASAYAKNLYVSNVARGVGVVAGGWSPNTSYGSTDFWKGQK